MKHWFSSVKKSAQHLFCSAIIFSLFLIYFSQSESFSLVQTFKQLLSWLVDSSFACDHLSSWECPFWRVFLRDVVYQFFSFIFIEEYVEFGQTTQEVWRFFEVIRQDSFKLNCIVYAVFILGKLRFYDLGIINNPSMLSELTLERTKSHEQLRYFLSPPPTLWRSITTLHSPPHLSNFDYWSLTWALGLLRAS